MTVSRRGVVKGAAWTAPAIMVGTQAPALAASPTCPDDAVRLVSSSNCKMPGDSQGRQAYRITLEFANDCTAPAVITIVDVAMDNKGVSGTPGAEGSSAVVPPGGGTVLFHIDATNSANKSMVVTYTVTVEGNTSTVTETVNFTSFSPCPKA